MISILIRSVATEENIMHLRETIDRSLMFLSLLFCFRIDHPVRNEVRTGYEIDTVTFLDRDRIELRGKDTDVFVAAQSHHTLGHLFSSVIRENNTEDLIKHIAGDKFYVQKAGVVLNYTYRGGSRVSFWQIPSGLCGDYNIYSTQQRSAVIKVNDTFTEDTKICWFLNFRKSVTYDVSFRSASGASTVLVADQRLISSDSQAYIKPGDAQSGQLGSTHVIALDAKAGPVDLEVNVNCDVDFGDWTDHPSFITKRGESAQPTKPMYIETNRQVAAWIWTALVGTFIAISTFTTLLFFAKPHQNKSKTE